MNTFTFFALLVCAILAMVGAAPEAKAPEPIPIAAADSLPIDDVLEVAESRGHGYNGGGGYNKGGGHHDHHDHHDHHHDHHDHRPNHQQHHGHYGQHGR